jgi:hypothetical protein
LQDFLIGISLDRFAVSQKNSSRPKPDTATAPDILLQPPITSAYARRSDLALGSVQSSVEEVMSPTVVCMIFGALSQWHFGEIASSQAALAEGVSLAKELNDTYGLGHAIWFAGFLGHFKRNPAEVERVASAIELSTRQNFTSWLAGGEVLRSWARSAG